MAEPLVALRGIRKVFPGVVANDGVDLDIFAGEIHALLGENGAGKSTLAKVFYGFSRPEAGQIFVRGAPAALRSPRDARALGVGMVFQTFTLIPAMTVVENVALFLPRSSLRLDYHGIARQIAEMSTRFGLAVDPWRPAGSLSIGEQQKVEIIKLLLAEAEVLILDEPTRVLAPHEVDGLIQVMHRLRENGYAVVFITHKLREVLQAATRITVMRRGKVAASLQRDEATEDRLLALMFGTLPAGERRPERTTVQDHSVLELHDVTAQSPGAGLDGIDLVVRAGEIVGVAGVSGNGQRELGDLILGLLPCRRGTKRLFGADATRWPVGRIRERGVGFIPEDPLRWAVVAPLTVTENMALGAMRRYARLGGLVMDWPAVIGDLDAALRRLSLEPLPHAARVGTLSGGNMQRLTLARELSAVPKLIVALYPTRGLDVASARSAHALLLAARERGAGVLLISEDLDELFGLADRIAVLRSGRITGVVRPQEATPTEVGRLMTAREAAYG